MVAEEAARRAGKIALEGYRGALQIMSKGGTDIVTQYDHAAEKEALDVLKAHYPDHAYLAEESGESGSAQDESDLEWMVDPIDGTHNYANQIPFWCISVAVADRGSGQVQAGVIYDPLHEELFSAHRGGGVTLNGQPIETTNKGEIGHAIIGYDIGHTPETSRAMVELVAWVQPRVGKVRHLGSAALSLTYVAAGRLDGYYHLGLQAWDIGAALLLIEEAGGLVTNWDGTPRRSGAGGVVAAGKRLHPELLKLLTRRS